MSYRENSDPGSLLIIAFNGRMFGMDPATGKRVWEQKGEGGTTLFAVVGDRVIATGLYFYCLVCLDYQTGKELWRTRTQASFGTTLLVHDGRAFVGYDKGVVECFTIDGAPLWRDEFKGHGEGSVTLGFLDHVAQPR